MTFYPPGNMKLRIMIIQFLRNVMLRSYWISNEWRWKNMGEGATADWIETERIITQLLEAARPFAVHMRSPINRYIPRINVTVWGWARVLDVSYMWIIVNCCSFLSLSHLYSHQWTFLRIREAETFPPSYDYCNGTVVVYLLCHVDFNNTQKPLKVSSLFHALKVLP